MTVQRRCEKCHNAYAPDEAPGILCPICQVGQDSFERGIKALAVGLGVIGGVVAALVGVWWVAAALVNWSGFPLLATVALLTVATVVSLFVAWVVGEATLDEIAKRKAAHEK